MDEPMSTGTDHDGTDLGRRIREHRGEAGLSMAEAADRAGDQVPAQPSALVATQAQER